jgi:The GLUG motif.
MKYKLLIFIILSFLINIPLILIAQNFPDTIMVRGVDSTLSSGTIVTRDVVFYRVNNSYEVGSVMQLRAISKHISQGSAYSFADTSFALTQDIVFTDADNIYSGSTWSEISNFIPIGGCFNTGTYAFKGKFNGNDYRIIGLRIIKNSSSNYIGLFGQIDNTTIKNIGIENAMLKGGNNIGGLCGSVNTEWASSSTISSCYVTKSNIEGNNYVGGLCGYNWYLFTISNCYATSSNIIGIENTGGLLGKNSGNVGTNNSIISNVYSTCKVKKNSNSGSNTNFGGLFGNIVNCSISNAYYRTDWKSGTISGVTENSQTTGCYSIQLNAMKYSFASTLDTLFKDDYTALQANNGFPLLSWQDSKTIYAGDTVLVTNASGAVPTHITISDSGSLINNTSTNINATIEKKLIGNTWNFVGTPTTNTPTAGIYLGVGAEDETYNNSLDYQVAMIKYDYSTNSWLNTSNEMTYLGYNSPINTGEGYFAYPFGTRTTIQSNNGTLYNDESTQITTQNNFGTEHSQNGNGYWYALSNPYPANIYVNKFLEGDTTIQGNVVYTYLSNGSWNTTNTTIKAGEGFFISYPSGGSKTINFAKTYLTLSSKKSTTIEPMQILATTNGLSKEAYIKINDNASNGFDINDAYKMIGDNAQMAEPYFVVDSNILVINAIHSAPYECPINFHTLTTGITTLTFTNIPPGVNAILIDDTAEIALTDSTQYTTTLAVGENANRFKIRLYSLSSLEQLEQQPLTNNISIWVVNKTLNIEGLNLQKLEVFNVLGQKIYTAKLSGNRYSGALNLPSGIYIANVKYRETDTIFAKIAVK